ncbi:transcriptional regulator [Klebsiella pneumoniae]|uniref:Transcriptional regulator n=1 Tax=Klebsiella pneumoniae TaxID=573 RepID=A0A2X3F3Z7_KLEPN|nr:transcriptional regulator [Klebsiella pneumoniae]
MNLFTAVLYLHIATVAVSVGLFVLRYWWMYHQSPLAEPAVGANCTALQRYAAVSQRRGVNGDNALPAVHRRRRMADGKAVWRIIYIALGFIALGRRRPRSQQSRFIAFLLALVVLFIIIQLAITRIPILG